MKVTSFVWRIPSKRKFDGPSSRLKYKEKDLQPTECSKVVVEPPTVG